jgi:3'-phosphoadenosine 5'-phosphosulfate sulfotransferase (PAPS reductase)/FAD synthetase
MINLVSVSGGKDSTATLLVAIERGVDNIRAVFCDTGNEHPLTYDYLRYLEQATGIGIHWIKQDFTDWWWRRRDYVRDKWPEKGVPADVVARVLAFMEQGPTGNPYLDLCIIKSRFPSRRAQFCTQFLKTEPATEYALELIAQHGAVCSWQGVRAEESPNRANLPEREDKGGGYSIYRPIHKWTAAQVFDQHRKHGIEPNPLYKLGMNRVGCMPCINARKDEILEISKRFPDQIDRIEEWERIVGNACRRGFTTFFALLNDGSNKSPEDHFSGGNIRAVVEWSKTQRGGRHLDMFKAADEPAACSSSYGLCE